MSAPPREAFIKSAGPHGVARLDAEVDGLAALRATATVRVPATLARGTRDNEPWLALERLDLRPLDARSGAALGTSLAALHRAAVPGFADRHGWHTDNFIGATPQENTPCASWAAFWRDRRLRPQLTRAARAGHTGVLQAQGERLAASVEALLRGHAPAPSLLHGDLWAGNAGALPDGTPVIFDPAIYVGDREADIAMTELFGGFTPAFYAAYREAWPIDGGYAIRRELYNLYHLINHLNLFGVAYLGRCERALARLLAAIR